MYLTLTTCFIFTFLLERKEAHLRRRPFEVGGCGPYAPRSCACRACSSGLACRGARPSTARGARTDGRARLRMRAADRHAVPRCAVARACLPADGPALCATPPRRVEGIRVDRENPEEICIEVGGPQLGSTQSTGNAATLVVFSCGWRLRLGCGATVPDGLLAHHRHQRCMPVLHLPWPPPTGGLPVGWRRQHFPGH